uniref:BZIP domain-containing protein n=1 Tax=Elaeophora elaphi TaxID=1147741 RepID=A0A0R3RY91_9BILA
MTTDLIQFASLPRDLDRPRQAVAVDRERARADGCVGVYGNCKKCAAMPGAPRKKCAERKILAVRNKRKRRARPTMAQQTELLGSLVGENDSQPEMFRKLLKHEQRETPPRLSPAVDGLSSDPSVSPDNSNSSNGDNRKPCVLLPRNSDDNEESLLDRKDEVQRLLARTAKQEMPQLDNECQNAACGQDNGTDPESAATSSVHSDDTPPRLTVAQVVSLFMIIARKR